MSVLSALTGSKSNAATVESSAPKAGQAETWWHDGDVEVIRSLGQRRPKSQQLQKNHIATCRDCRKTFKRPCDLTKHQKTHSRPWKCHEEKCKYHYTGWPTEKERDRHVTDKHSSAPTRYTCLYPPCAYASKRESNCKQHMEKAHGWVYIRSKSHGRKTISHTNHTISPSVPLPYIPPVFSSSYATSSNDSYAMSTNVSVTPGDSGRFDEGFADGEPTSPNKLVDFTLWSDPPESSTLSESRSKQLEFALFDFEQPALESTLLDPPTPIEAKNTGKAYSSAKEPQSLEVPRGEPASLTGTESSFDPAHESSKESGKVQLPVLSAPGFDPTSSRQPEEAEPIIPGLTHPSPTPDQLRAPPDSTKRSFDVDTNGDKISPPLKRVKKCTPKRVKLRLMSCIYRKHKPEMYNYNDSKFKTCHTTSHEYISTLVRHLERYHSAVLCHTCLSAFEDVKDKDEHKETTKCKAAYGSQEDKWQMLYKTLCGDGNQHSPYFECTSGQSSAAASMETQQSSQGTSPEDKAKSPTSQSSAHTTAFVSSGQLVAPSTPVPLNNSEREELERLREENNRLLRENNALLRRVLQWESVYATIDTSIAPMPVATQV